MSSAILSTTGKSRKSLAAELSRMLKRAEVMGLVKEGSTTIYPLSEGIQMATEMGLKISPKKGDRLVAMCHISS
jgi:hypothetical protein